MHYNVIGQYVRVGRTLPQALLYDLMAISDKYGTEIKKGLESHHNHGMWGDSKYIYGKEAIRNNQLSILGMVEEIRSLFFAILIP